MIQGLVETHGWDAGQVADYLATCPGLGPEWDDAALRALVDQVA